MTTTLNRQPTTRELLGSRRWEAIYQEPDMYLEANGNPLHCGDRVRDAGGNLGELWGNSKPDHLDVRWDDGTVSQVLPGQLVREDDEPPCSVVHGHTGEGPCPECARYAAEAEARADCLANYE